MFAEGGVYQKPLGWNLLLDGYAQAGVVGIRSRDFFADGGLAVSRPVWGRFSAGMGVWGGYQPGLYRVDAGSAGFDACPAERQPASRLAPASRRCGGAGFRSRSDTGGELLESAEIRRCGLASGRLCR